VRGERHNRGKIEKRRTGKPSQKALVPGGESREGVLCNIQMRTRKGSKFFGRKGIKEGKGREKSQTT